MKIRALLLPLLFAMPVALLAQAPAPPEGEPLDPVALDAIKAKIGQVVTVEGIIVRSGENRSGTIRYLNFTQNFRESASLVFFASRAPEEFTKEKVDAWVNKKVRATGKVSEFNDQLQIVIEKWDQVVEAQ